MSGVQGNILLFPKILYITVSGILYFLVIIANGFIAAVNLASWMKGRRLMPNDEIVTSLGISNFCFSTTVMMDYFISFVWSEFYRNAYSVQNLTLTFDIATGFLSCWLTAWLCVFYCMKIVNFKQPLLLKVKLNFPKLVRWFLLASMIASVVTTFFAFRTFKRVPLSIQANDWNNQTISFPTNVNLTSNYQKPSKVLVLMRFPFKLLIMILGCAVPLVLSMSSLVLVLNSLFRHAQNLEKHSSVFYNPHLEAHLKAARAVLSLLLSNVCFFAVVVIVRTQVFPNWTYQHFLCLIFQFVAIAAHASVLILSSPKLKSAALQFLPCVQQYSETEIILQ
ncbi:taste receptor type 2 member 41-like [Pogona vitticeps]